MDFLEALFGILGFFILIAFIFSTLLLVGVSLREEVEVIDGPCYDRFGNEIHELVCDHSIYDYGWMSWYFKSPTEQKESILEQMK